MHRLMLETFRVRYLLILQLELLPFVQMMKLVNYVVSCKFIIVGSKPLMIFCLQIDRSGMIPMLRFRDRESYAGNKTKEYDDFAMKYLSGVLFFLVICSSIYSLMYERHKSWYSWVLSSFTSCVYMFGKLLSHPIVSFFARLKFCCDLFCC